MSNPRSRALRRRAAAALLGIGGALVMAEVLLRLVPSLLPVEVQSHAAGMPGVSARRGVFRFFAEYRRVWEPDDWLRERLRPGVDVVLHGAPEYPEWPLQSDDLGLGPAGFRDTPPTGDPYAVVLGDSFGFGVGVRREEIWSERLEQSTGLEFVNLSQVGASSLHEERIYQRYGTRFRARVVVWMFFSYRRRSRCIDAST